jgi:hypothetical protein
LLIISPADEIDNVDGSRLSSSWKPDGAAVCNDAVRKASG